MEGRALYSIYKAFLDGFVCLYSSVVGLTMVLLMGFFCSNLHFAVELLSMF